VSFTSERDLGELAERLSGSERLILLLDYDGTLVSFASLPDLAAPDGFLLELLGALEQRSGTEVHLVSGRDRQTLERWLGHLPISLYAEHGFWSRERGADAWTALHEIPENWKVRVMPLFLDFANLTPGAFVEEKSASMAWHYRLADPELGESAARGLRDALAVSLADVPLQVITGDHVVEVRLGDANKGIVVARVTQGATCAVVAMGDDTTDEDMFAALPPGAISIHVGPAKSRATWRVGSPADVRSFLASLLVVPNRP